METLHPVGIDLGLERVSEVAKRMGLLASPIAPVSLRWQGLNGKGSTLAMIDSVARAHDWRVGTYTSPFITLQRTR
ncbi:hypothetical protein HORIV_31810 [Vreelandella olivaria]|uniref:Uncharacterized protein n=1 Tax=Vreelandella olivaria TaxID=390919 RepID=A0ABM7GJL4_9GAMM|nr:hypothetical protein HORIV_31810 [Halomonas olivaria]